MDAYNGYTGRERDKKYQEWKRLYPLGGLPGKVGPCALCADPACEVEPHSEDYAKPYRWEPPYEYMVCRRCHSRLHKRFNDPDGWRDFKAHVRRGGYAVEFTSAQVVAERTAAAEARSRNDDYEWSAMRDRTQRNGVDWWEGLTLTPAAVTDPRARPR